MKAGWMKEIYPIWYQLIEEVIKNPVMFRQNLVFFGKFCPSAFLQKSNV